MDGPRRVKTPFDHHRDVLAIARLQLARARDCSVDEPENEKWPDVISRLTDWLHRLQREEERFAARAGLLADLHPTGTGTPPGRKPPGTVAPPAAFACLGKTLG